MERYFVFRNTDLCLIILIIMVIKMINYLVLDDSTFQHLPAPLGFEDEFRNTLFHALQPLSQYFQFALKI